MSLTVSSPSTGEPGSVAQRERRRRILDATIELASAGGFDAVQMRAVADGAGVAMGTLYRYFPSKIHLLVSALAREFERGKQAQSGRPVPGATRHERVLHTLGRASKTLQSDPHLTEALTRAFMFADASVKAEIEHVAWLLTSMLTRAMAGTEPAPEPTSEEVAIARVIGNVWLSALMGWVTGRSTAEEVADQMDVAVRLLLRD